MVLIIWDSAQNTLQFWLEVQFLLKMEIVQIYRGTLMLQNYVLLVLSRNAKF